MNFDPFKKMAAILAMVALASSGCGKNNQDNNQNTPEDEPDLTSCTPGALDCACGPGSACDAGAMCVSNMCVAMEDMGAPDMPSPGDDMAPGENMFGPQGGTLTFEGGELMIPSGALDEEVEITARRVELDPGDTYQMYGWAYAFEPEGLVFNTPATVTFPREGAPSETAVHWTLELEQPRFTRLQTTLDGEVASAAVDQLGAGFVGVKLPPEDERAVTCMKVDVRRVDAYAPASVRALVMATHCDDGAPVVRDPARVGARIEDVDSGGAFENSAIAAAKLSEYATSLALSVNIDPTMTDDAATLADALEPLLDATTGANQQEARYATTLSDFGRTSQRLERGALANLEQAVAPFALGGRNLDLDLFEGYVASISAIEKSMANPIDKRALVLLIDSGQDPTARGYEAARRDALAARQRAIEQGIDIFVIAVAATPEAKAQGAELASAPANFIEVDNLASSRETMQTIGARLASVPYSGLVVGGCTGVTGREPGLSLTLAIDGVSETVTSTYEGSALTGDTSSCVAIKVADPCGARTCGESAIPGFSCGTCLDGNCPQDGICACPEGSGLCAGECVPLDTSDNCGACGVTCNNNCALTSDNTRACDDIIAIEANGTSTCARSSLGNVWCWGNVAQATRPKRYESLSDIVDLSVYSDHTCALDSSGDAWCWGSGNFGQLGDGMKQDSASPIKVQVNEPLRDISAGYLFTCAVTESGRILCWGSGNNGRLGNGSADESAVPVVVQGITNAVSVAAGGAHACALLETGSIRCWGAGSFGQLGNNTQQSSLVPVDVIGLNAPTEIRMGNTTSCATDTSRQLRCWGSNQNGILGNDVMVSSIPLDVPGMSNVQAFALDSSHICGIPGSGDLRCWGANSQGQLGDGTKTNQSTPQVVPGITGVVDVATGTAHSCALLDTGEVRCWGFNSSGQLGDGTTENSLLHVTVQW